MDRCIYFATFISYTAGSQRRERAVDVSIFEITYIHCTCRPIASPAPM